MTAHHLIPSDEAHWRGVERIWSGVQQFPPRRERSGWWLVAAGAMLVAVGLWGMR